MNDTAYNNGKRVMKLIISFLIGATCAVGIIYAFRL
jgi:hypothetical protein